MTCRHPLPLLCLIRIIAFPTRLRRLAGRCRHVGPRILKRCPAQPCPSRLCLPLAPHLLPHPSLLRVPLPPLLLLQLLLSLQLLLCLDQPPLLHFLCVLGGLLGAHRAAEGRRENADAAAAAGDEHALRAGVHQHVPHWRGRGDGGRRRQRCAGMDAPLCACAGTVMSPLCLMASNLSLKNKKFFKSCVSCQRLHKDSDWKWPQLIAPNVSFPSPLCWERASDGKAVHGTARVQKGQWTDGQERWQRKARRTHGAGRGASRAEVHHAAAAGAVAAAGACHSEGPAVDRPTRLPPSTCRRLVGKSAAVQVRDRLLPHIQHACRSQSPAPI